MSRLIFWDTSAFVALMNARDTLHAPAVTVSQRLTRDKARMITTDAILTEVANGLSKVGHRALAHRVVNSVQQSVGLGVAEVVHIDSALWQRGWQLYCARPDKEWGLTDCFSFVVLQDRGLFEVFTADHHFEQAGFVRLIRS